MHSIRIQLLGFITTVLLSFLVILNIYPITSSRDLIFEEKRSALSFSENTTSRDARSG